MKTIFFIPLVMKVEAKGPKQYISEKEIRDKIAYQIADWLIHWQQSDGVEVTARLKE